MEVAFNGPKKLYDRLGGKLDVHEVAAFDPEAFATIAMTPPAIHRYGGSMGRRVQALCQYVVEHYDGDTAAIWTSSKPTGVEVLRRLKALPGFGEQKAKIFLALLGKQYGVAPYGWRKAAGDYGGTNTRMSVADVNGPESLAKVRAYKKAKKAAVKAEG